MWLCGLCSSHEARNHCCEVSWDGSPWLRTRSFYQGVDEYTEEVLVGLSDEFRELKKTIAANVQVDLKDGCTLYQWYMDVTPVKFRMNTCAACTGLMHPMRPEDTASCPTSSTGTLQRLSRLVSVSRRVSQGFCRLCLCGWDHDGQCG